jgi:hypothetical protein
MPALVTANFRLIRARYINAIKPEARRRVYWTMVSIDTFVSVGATSAFSLERFCREARRADLPHR